MSRSRYAAALLAVAAIGVAGCGQPRSQPATARPTAVVATTPARVAEGASVAPADGAGPTTVVDGVPMGYRQDRAGATAAAVTFARLNESLVLMGEEEAATARRVMATEGASDELATDIVAQLGEFRQAWPVGELTYRVAPVAVRVDEESPERVRVDVWFVGVVAGRNLPTYEEWITESYRLAWERGDWRVASLSETSGPRPDVGYQEPASPAEMSALLAGFEPVR